MWEHDEYMSQPEKGLMLQMRISYREKNGKIYRETVTRRYFKDGDYQDSTHTEVINAYH